VVGGLGLAILAAGVTGLAHDRPTPRDFGVAVPTTTGIGVPRPGPPSAPPTEDVRAREPTVTPAPPTELTIPAIHVHTSVQPVENVHGSLAVPDDPARTGWWAGGALPGSPTGSVVLDGHVDSLAGRGALFRLTDLRAGDRIVLTTAAHQQIHYAVTGRRVIAKAAPLPGDLFSPNGVSRLVLITCGGPFNHTSRTYQDNIAVFATPT